MQLSDSLCFTTSHHTSCRCVFYFMSWPCTQWALSSLVCELSVGLSVQNSHRSFFKVSTESPYPAPSALDGVFPLLVLLLCLSLWKLWALSSSFCYFSCGESRFLFLWEQWGSVINVRISRFKHWPKEIGSQREEQNTSFNNSIILQYWCSITFIMLFRSYKLEIQGDKVELAWNNAARTPCRRSLGCQDILSASGQFGASQRSWGHRSRNISRKVWTLIRSLQSRALSCVRDVTTLWRHCDGLFKKS